MNIKKCVIPGRKWLNFLKCLKSKMENPISPLRFKKSNYVIRLFFQLDFSWWKYSIRFQGREEKCCKWSKLNLIQNIFRQRKRSIQKVCVKWDEKRKGEIEYRFYSPDNFSLRFGWWTYGPDGPERVSDSYSPNYKSIVWLYQKFLSPGPHWWASQRTNGQTDQPTDTSTQSLSHCVFVTTD